MSKFNGGLIDVELVLDLRAAAERGTDIPELAELIRRRLELDDQNAVFPTIIYFRTAFLLSLRDALPLRELVTCRDRSEIDSLLIPAMGKSKDRWQTREAVRT